MSGGKIQCMFSSDPRVFIHVVSCAQSQGAAQKSGCYCLFTLGSYCVLQERLEHAWGQCMWKHRLQRADPVGLRVQEGLAIGVWEESFEPLLYAGFWVQPSYSETLWVTLGSQLHWGAKDLDPEPSWSHWIPRAMISAVYQLFLWPLTLYDSGECWLSRGIESTLQLRGSVDGDLGWGGKGTRIQEGVGNKARITPILERPKARPGLHIPLHGGWGTIIDSAKFLVVSFACDLSLDFPSSINGHCNTHLENHPERRDTARQAQIRSSMQGTGRGSCLI